MALAVLTLTPAALAGQVVEIQREIIDSQRRLEAVREERSRLQRDLTSLEGQVRNASTELANVERQVSASRAAVDEVDFQVDAVGGEYETTSRSLLFTRERLLTATAVLNRRLRDIYKRGSLHSVRVMLGAGSFSGLLTRYRYLRLIASYDRTLVRRVKELETDSSPRERSSPGQYGQLGSPAAVQAQRSGRSTLSGREASPGALYL